MACLIARKKIILRFHICRELSATVCGAYLLHQETLKPAFMKSNPGVKAEGSLKYNDHLQIKLQSLM